MPNWFLMVMFDSDKKAWCSQWREGEVLEGWAAVLKKLNEIKAEVVSVVPMGANEGVEALGPGGRAFGGFQVRSYLLFYKYPEKQNTA